MSVKLDFSILDELDEKQATEQGNHSPPAKKVYYKLKTEERQKAANAEATVKQLEVYTAHQEAIIKSGQLANEITKGIQAGEKIENLFLKAIECISLITGNSLFYEQNKNNLKNINGIDIDTESGVEVKSAEELNKFLE
jgi:hypothetical protein